MYLVCLGSSVDNARSEHVHNCINVNQALPDRWLFRIAEYQLRRFPVQLGQSWGSNPTRLNRRRKLETYRVGDIRYSAVSSDCFGLDSKCLITVQCNWGNFSLPRVDVDNLTCWWYCFPKLEYRTPQRWSQLIPDHEATFEPKPRPRTWISTDDRYAMPVDASVILENYIGAFINSKAVVLWASL